jgi:uncharacterized protein YjiS (DUF1127 family)
MARPARLTKQEQAMTIIALTRSTAGMAVDGASGSGLAGIALSMLKQLFRAYHNRCVVAALDGFSDQRLADIGLTRGDLRDGFAEPIWRDPTRLMRDRALGRHRT